MSKLTVFVLNVTLKAGSDVYVKGSSYTEETLPDKLRDEVASGSGTIEVKSYGDDFESSSFDPEETITLKEPTKMLKTKKVLKKKKI
jgi:hypothetical protein